MKIQMVIANTLASRLFKKFSFKKNGDEGIILFDSNILLNSLRLTSFPNSRTSPNQAIRKMIKG